MSGALGNCSPTRLLCLLGLNPSEEDDHGSDQLLSLLGRNDREGDPVKSLEARSPVSGAVPCSFLRFLYHLLDEEYSPNEESYTKARKVLGREVLDMV